MLRTEENIREEEIQVVGAVISDYRAFFEIETRYTDLESQYAQQLMLEFETQINKGLEPNERTILGTGKFSIGDYHDKFGLVVSAGNIKHYDRKIQERKRLDDIRKQVSLLSTAVMQDDYEQAMNIINETNNLFYKKEKHDFTAVEAVQSYIDDLGKNREYYTIPFTFLMEKIYGIEPKKLYVIAARPGVGKSAFSMQIAFHIAKNYNVRIYQMEMDEKETLGRELSSYDVDYSAIQKNEYSESLNNRLNIMYNLNFTLNVKSNWKLNDLLNDIRYHAKYKDVKVFFIDQITHIRTDRDRRNEQIDEITSKLKNIAKELNIGVVIVSQINRDAENKMPNPGNLKAGGGLEENSDTIILLHRPDIDKPNIQVIVPKCRNGLLGTVEMIFNGKQMEFVEVENNN